MRTGTLAGWVLSALSSKARGVLRGHLLGPVVAAPPQYCPVVAAPPHYCPIVAAPPQYVSSGGLPSSVLSSGGLPSSVCIQ